MFRYVRVLLCLAAVVSWFGCSGTAAPASAQVPARPIWTYNIPQGKVIIPAAVSGSIAILGGYDATIVSVADGKERWSVPNVQPIGFHADRLYVGDSAGRVLALRLSDGRAMWRTSNICRGQWKPIPSYERYLFDTLYVACGDNIARVAPDTGKIALLATPMSADRIDSIEQLDASTLALSGWASGATLREYAGIVRARTLQPIAFPMFAGDVRFDVFRHVSLGKPVNRLQSVVTANCFSGTRGKVRLEEPSARRT